MKKNHLIQHIAHLSKLRGVKERGFKTKGGASLSLVGIEPSYLHK